MISVTIDWLSKKHYSPDYIMCKMNVRVIGTFVDMDYDADMAIDLSILNQNLERTMTNYKLLVMS